MNDRHAQKIFPEAFLSKSVISSVIYTVISRKKANSYILTGITDMHISNFSGIPQNRKRPTVLLEHVYTQYNKLIHNEIVRILCM